MSAAEILASNDCSFARAERILYGLDDFASAETVCFVEGEIDKFSIETAGGPATARVPDGAPPPDTRNYTSRVSFLGETAMGYLHTATTVLIATDIDAPGQRLADELAKCIGHATCRRVSCPEGGQDANAVLGKPGVPAVRDALAEARSSPIPASPPPGTRPTRMLPPSRARHPIIELAPVEARHAR
jgi:twinkle protein